MDTEELAQKILYRLAEITEAGDHGYKNLATIAQEFEETNPLKVQAATQLLESQALIEEAHDQTGWFGKLSPSGLMRVERQRRRVLARETASPLAAQAAGAENPTPQQADESTQPAPLYGPWRVLKPLGEGGQGHTFVVEDARNPGEQFVLKLIKDERKDRKGLERLRREVATISKLDHPNILRFVDSDLEAPEPYFVTEYCRGGSLDRALAFWRDSPARALGLFLDICGAVSYAHAQRVVHRDIKPPNIFLRGPEGPAVLGDFGICYLLDDTSDRLTTTAELVGPRTFIAPEFEGGRQETVNEKGDVYSLGKLLHWLLSGGRTLPRESFRSPELDLRQMDADTQTGWRNPHLEHANRLLDLMITLDPNHRRPASNIEILATRAASLIERRITPVTPDSLRPCDVCGEGVYQEVEEQLDRKTFRIGDDFGGRDWRTLICTACGHVQLFRPDLAARKEWWAERSPAIKSRAALPPARTLTRPQLSALAKARTAATEAREHFKLLINERDRERALAIALELHKIEGEMERVPPSPIKDELRRLTSRIHGDHRDTADELLNNEELQLFLDRSLEALIETIDDLLETEPD